MQSIREMWDAFAAKALPATVPEPQWLDLRFAFYQGVYALFVELNDAASTNEAEVNQMLSSIADELEQFVRDVQAGKA